MDKAFDTDAIIADLNERGAKVVISQHPRRSTPLDIDLDVYKWRHLIENFICKLMEFKRIAMRSDKTDTSFIAMIYAKAAVINSRAPLKIALSPSLRYRETVNRQWGYNDGTDGFF